MSTLVLFRSITHEVFHVGWHSGRNIWCFSSNITDLGTIKSHLPFCTEPILEIFFGVQDLHFAEKIGEALAFRCNAEFLLFRFQACEKLWARGPTLMHPTAIKFLVNGHAFAIILRNPMLQTLLCSRVE